MIKYYFSKYKLNPKDTSSGFTFGFVQIKRIRAQGEQYSLVFQDICYQISLHTKSVR